MKSRKLTKAESECWTVLKAPPQKHKTIEEELTEIMAEEITLDIDREIIEELRKLLK